jgi:ribosomal protein S18 acetylase RimI-like enzyme
MKIQRFDDLQNKDRLAKIIFLNFFNLQYEQNIDFSIESILEILNNPALIGWFLLDNNEKIIGYLIGKTQGLNDGRFVYYISYFYIVNKYRNNGLGTRMLLTCMEYIKNQNISNIMLITKNNSRAHKLYTSLGFDIDPLIKIKNNDYVVISNYSFTNS